MTIRRLPLAAFLACTLAAPVLSSAGWGKTRPSRQSPSVSSKAPQAAKPPVYAHLRLWKACDSQDSAELTIRLLSPGGQSSRADVSLPSSHDVYQFTGYDDVPTGPGTIEITQPNQPSTLLGISLAKDQDYTLLIRAQKGQVVAELLPDTRSNDHSPSFNAYSLLFGGKGEVQVTLGSVLSGRFNATGGRLRARGLKADLYPITVAGTDSKGHTFRWNAEADQRKTPHSTLVICLDAYGRIRPQLLEDGVSPDAVPSTKMIGTGEQ